MIFFVINSDIGGRCAMSDWMDVDSSWPLSPLFFLLLLLLLLLADGVLLILHHLHHVTQRLTYITAPSSSSLFSRDTELVVFSLPLSPPGDVVTNPRLFSPFLQLSMCVWLYTYIAVRRKEKETRYAAHNICHVVKLHLTACPTSTHYHPGTSHSCLISLQQLYSMIFSRSARTLP